MQEKNAALHETQSGSSRDASLAAEFRYPAAAAPSHRCVYERERSLRSPRMHDSAERGETLTKGRGGTQRGPQDLLSL